MKRFALGDLPEILPLFPLPGALLLPRADLPLHIFEPRYLAMIEEALATPGRLIAMIQPLGTEDQDPQPATSRLAAIGCAGRITRFAEIEDGRLMVTLTGISRFRLRDEVEGFTPWRRAKVEWGDFIRDLGAAEEDPQFDRESFLALVGRFIAHRKLQVDPKALARAEDEMLINALSMLCPFRPEDRQALLEAPNLASRRETLAALLEFALLGGDAEGKVIQ